MCVFVKEFDVDVRSILFAFMAISNLLLQMNIVEFMGVALLMHIKIDLRLVQFCSSSGASARFEPLCCRQMLLHCSHPMPEEKTKKMPEEKTKSFASLLLTLYVSLSHLYLYSKSTAHNQYTCLSTNHLVLLQCDIANHLALLQCDIALLTVEDDEFWEGVEGLEIGGLPTMQESVVVVGVGCTCACAVA
jgi:hypothetical protein